MSERPSHEWRDRGENGDGEEVDTEPDVISAYWMAREDHMLREGVIIGAGAAYIALLVWEMLMRRVKSR